MKNAWTPFGGWVRGVRGSIPPWSAGHDADDEDDADEDDDDADDDDGGGDDDAAATNDES